MTDLKGYVLFTHRAFICGVPVRVGFIDENTPYVKPYYGFNWLFRLVVLFIGFMNYQNINYRLVKPLDYFYLIDKETLDEY